MGLEKRSVKSKEKFADGLMSLANTIHGAALVAILVFPLTAFISAVLTGGAMFSWLDIVHHFSGINLIIFGVVYLTPIVVGMYAKDKAMDMYDQIEAGLRKSEVEAHQPFRLKKSNASPNILINRTIKKLRFLESGYFKC